MGNEIGRNEPCPCGSGKKYKRCCLAREAPAPAESRYARQKEMMKALGLRLMRWSSQGEFAGRGPEAARSFYGGGSDGEVDEDDMQLFVPYWLWKWKPAPDAGGVGESFLRAHGGVLSSAEREYIEQAIAQPLRFLDVVAVQPGEGLRVRDILTGREAEVREMLASRRLQAGDIIFAQVVCVEGITSIEGFGSVPLPPGYMAEVVRMRQSLEKAAGGRKLAEEDLEAIGAQLRSAYLAMVERFRTPPTLVNTDGDAIEFHTLLYRLAAPPAAAFTALASLAWGHTRAELLEGEELDERGELTAVEIPWLTKGNKMHKEWDNTILGHLWIRGASLRAEVNSAARAKRLRALIERRLGSAATFASDTIRPAEEMMAQAQAQSRRSQPERERDPELAAMEREFEERHPAAWVDTALPVLDGQTPREAVREPDGREIVEALLAEWARHDRVGIDHVRRELGLDAAAAR